MALVVKRDEHNVGEAFLEVWIKVGKFTPQAGLKRDQIYADGQASGYRIGLAHGLSAWATGERCKRAERVAALNNGYVEIVTRHDAQKFFKSMESLRKLDKNMSDEEWDEAIRVNLDHLIWPEEMRAKEEEARRQAVLAGKEPPRPEDESWLEEELDKNLQMAAPFTHAITRIKHLKQAALLASAEEG